jgi:hypothetical protein
MKINKFFPAHPSFFFLFIFNSFLVHINGNKITIEIIQVMRKKYFIMLEVEFYRLPKCSIITDKKKAYQEDLYTVNWFKHFIVQNVIKDSLAKESMATPEVINFIEFSLGHVLHGRHFHMHFFQIFVLKK